MKTINFENSRAIRDTYLYGSLTAIRDGLRSVEDVFSDLSSQYERLLTQRPPDGATVSPIERDWSGEVEDKAWAYLQNRPAGNADR